MLVLRLWAWYSGYVVIRVKGPALERFINLAASRGIRLWAVRRVSRDLLFAATSRAGFKQLRPLARRLQCQMRIQRRRGLPFVLARVAQRRVLAIGCVLALILLYALGSLVWTVRVTGARQVPERAIRQYLAAQGLRPGAPLARQDRDALAHGLIRRFPLLTWAGIEPHGMLVQVRVVEKAVVPAPPREPAHLVASVDGLVTSCVVIRGQPVIKPGDTVERGQVLISGVVAGEGAYLHVRAEGEVWARVWREAVRRVLLSGVNERLTGRVWRQYVVVVGKHRFAIPRGAAPFRHYRLEQRRTAQRNPLAIVEFQTLVYRELVKAPFAQSQARADTAARQSADATLAKAIAGLKVRERRVERWSEKNAVAVRVVVETEEQIQRLQPIAADAPPPPELPPINQGREKIE